MSPFGVGAKPPSQEKEDASPGQKGWNARGEGVRAQERKEREHGPIEKRWLVGIGVAALAGDKVIAGFDHLPRGFGIARLIRLCRGAEGRHSEHERGKREGEGLALDARTRHGKRMVTADSGVC